MSPIQPKINKRSNPYQHILTTDQWESALEKFKPALDFALCSGYIFLTKTSVGTTTLDISRRLVQELFDSILIGMQIQSELPLLCIQP